MGRTVVDQTSARLLPEAVEALRTVARNRGCSRDSAIRGLLDEYVSKQESLGAGERLSHATAVFRYPPLPLGRYRPDGRIRVPARLESGTMEKLSMLTLRLPGQPRRRGQKDYARSPLAEALTTAISLEAPFKVDGLAGIPQIWTHSAAVGLWRLTVAATLTTPEQLAVLGNLIELDTNLEDPTALATLLREGDLAWHHPWRFEVALHLARNLLSGPNRASYWHSLHARDGDFDALRYDLELTDDLDHDFLRGAPTRARSDMTGRGGALVWRGRRSLALLAIRKWLVSGPATPLIVSPPHAKITHPNEWTQVRVPAGKQLPDGIRADVESNRVLALSTDEYTSIWPYLQGTMTPVPGFDIVIEELPGRRPEEILELVLLNEERLIDVYLEPGVAYDLGFIPAEERDKLIEDAAAKTAKRIEATLNRVDGWTPKVRAKLLALKNDPDRFFKLANEHHSLKEHAVSPWWVWTAGPTVAEIADLADTPERLRQLVRSRGRRWKRDLEATMEIAGRAAIARGHAHREELSSYEAESDEDEADLDVSDFFP